ncbi:capsular polysaccharide transport system ATP-binding protein [Paraburkholderia caballeronis]|uniref:ABC transporter ATP-binding protein n=1 Tax=Paraburkholderia caballeronis TaxID=416943 RepID=UPI001066A4D5|nr:ABC transporter ATP-binding protein [Paraburkholderia caballeronis]TDV37321.1 capsular polysaccharide transport system ATP-binding protein [Paraburkholderia caballeronis]
MIEIVNLTKSYRTIKGRYFVFKNLNFVIPSGKNVALLGRNGQGKSTLLRLLAGQDRPDSGAILSNRSISWPIGLASIFQGSLTGRQNTKFVARVHGADKAHIQEISQYVEDFAEIGTHFDMPVNTYSSGMKGRLAFGLSLAFNFDYYLIDEALSVGDAHFKKKASDALKEKVQKANVVLTSHGMSQVKQMCDMVFLLKNGVVEQYDDVDEGIRAYEKA